MVQMHKLDSFIKESFRLSGMAGGESASCDHELKLCSLTFVLWSYGTAESDERVHVLKWGEGTPGVYDWSCLLRCSR
jgi:hypothetical protein